MIKSHIKEKEQKKKEKYLKLIFLEKKKKHIVGNCPEMG